MHVSHLHLTPCLVESSSHLLSQATDYQNGVGGAVALNNVITLNMSGNAFVDNTAGLQGGALFFVGTTTSSLGVQSSRCIIVKPVAMFDPVLITMPLTEVLTCSFINNTAINDGGGAVYTYTLQDVFIYNITFVGNSAGGQGGAVESVWSPASSSGRVMIPH